MSQLKTGPERADIIWQKKGPAKARPYTGEET